MAAIFLLCFVLKIHLVTSSSNITNGTNIMLSNEVPMAEKIFTTIAHTAKEFCHLYSDTAFQCVITEQAVCIRAGVCLTISSYHFATQPGSGLCPYFPRNLSWCNRPLQHFYQVPSEMSLSQVTSFTCGAYNREGLLCSQCKPGYGPAVYAFSLMCVKCTSSTKGWILYLSLVLLPITIFYLLIIVLNIRVTSPPFTAFVFMCQTYCNVERTHTALGMKVSSLSRGSSTNILLHTVRILCGIWNLDFFRFLIPPFCVSSKLSNIQALYLEHFYIIYPLLLIIFTCICIELHAKNFKPLVIAWRPFHQYFIRLQKGWDPTASVINSFSTFTLLYSSKFILVVSHSLYPIKPYLKPTKGHSFLYFDPTVELYSAQHWKYLSCSIILSLFLLVIPILLLSLYPVKLFKRLLHCFLPSKWWLILNAFVDTFQGHYKDGTDGTRDFRVFSVLHFILLFFNIIVFPHYIQLLRSIIFKQSCCVMGSLLFAIVRPCKKSYANILQSLIMALTVFALLGLVSPFLDRQFCSLQIMLVCFLIPHIILGGYFMHRIIQRVCMHFNMISQFKKLKLWFERLTHKLKPNYSAIHHINCTAKSGQRNEESFTHADEHTALVQTCHHVMITVNHQ